MFDDQQASLTCKASPCGVGCPPGTNKVTQMNGQPGQLSTTDRCPKDKYQSLCCLAGTQTGKCWWRGWKGVGLPCVSGCKDGETEVSQNTNNHDHKKESQTCNGGLQSYCCAGFKSGLSKDQLEHDAGDFAKAAAEAAGAQAALDIAAKAFCRVAVPALLAPLELAEDLIPIVGEIADAVEIAATPAIIEGCVKGIEKAGKAEFKVFGKKHTLDINKPTKTDKDLPAPEKHDPPKKSNDSCKKSDNKKPDKVKRVPGPMPTRDTAAMALLRRNARAPVGGWRRGQAHMLREIFPAIGRLHQVNPIPEHYALVVGWVRETTKDEPGCTDGSKRYVEMDFDARPYDIGVDRRTGNCKLYRRDEFNTDKQRITNGNRLTDQGPVAASFTQELITTMANMVTDDMGKYKYANNNCAMFTDKLAKRLKANDANPAS